MKYCRTEYEGVEIMYEKIFLFGAGVERDFSLPSGAQYIQESLLTKKSLLYDALDELIYNEIEKNEYMNKYEKHYILRSDSIVYREIIFRALDKIVREYGLESVDTNKNEASNNKTVEFLTDDEQELFSLYWKEKQEDKDPDNGSKILKEKIKETYKHVVKEERQEFSSNIKDKIKMSKETKLSNYLTYYGTVEQNFSALINPKEAGIVKFWSLINFYWSAYFSIVIPLYSELNPRFKQESREDQYKEILSDLRKVTSEMYDKNKIKSLINKSEKTYYKIIDQILNENRIKNSSIKVLTTNYTPFLRVLFDEKNVSYLAGSIDLFEYPETLDVFDIKKENGIDKNKIIFPFLMTQAPVKPIVHSKQLLEYKKALDFLGLEREKVKKKLVIVGYGLNSDDNHINALIREFVVKGGRVIVYMYYRGGNKKRNTRLQE
jgi:chorismate mutase